MISATCSVPSRSASFLGCVQDFQPVMKPSVQSCGLRQAEHSSCLRFLDHSDIFQTDTAVPEGLENWSSYITVLISMGYISLSSGWSKINWLFFFFQLNLKKLCELIKSLSALSIDGAVVLWLGILSLQCSTKSRPISVKWCVILCFIYLESFTEWFNTRCCRK